MHSFNNLKVFILVDRFDLERDISKPLYSFSVVLLEDKFLKLTKRKKNNQTNERTNEHSLILVDLYYRVYL